MGDDDSDESRLGHQLQETDGETEGQEVTNKELLGTFSEEEAAELFALAEDGRRYRTQETTEDLLKKRIEMAESPEEANRWVKTLKSLGEYERIKERAGMVIGLEFLRFVAIVGLGSALIAFGQPEVGLGIISTQVLPTRRWQQLKELIHRVPENEQ